jgi:hypothetical protein
LVKGFLQQFSINLRFLLGSSSTQSRTQQNEEQLPNDCSVIRLARLPKDFEEKGQILAIQVNASAEDFALSSTDRKSLPPHLSVWAEYLTTPEQAYSFLPSNSSSRLAFRLNVGDICSIVGSLDQERKFPNLLNVIWIFLAERDRQNRPGAEGHAGITGLCQGSMPVDLLERESKKLRKDLRSKLAELASKEPSILITPTQNRTPL